MVRAPVAEAGAGRTLTARGAATRQRLLSSGEEVFGRAGYHDASIAEITRGAGVAMGTFYLYFDSKVAFFRALVLERGREMRSTMARATAGIEGRIERERAGFLAFFTWMAHHRDLYRVVRQAEFVDPSLFSTWYRTLAEGYAAALRRAMDDGEVTAAADVETLAYCLMGIGDFVGMRFLILADQRTVPRRAVETVMALIAHGLGGAGGADAPGSASADGGGPAHQA